MWGLAYKAAKAFWMVVAEEELPVTILKAMRALAVENLAVATAFVSPLLQAECGKMAVGAKVEPAGRRRVRPR